MTRSAQNRFAGKLLPLPLLPPGSVVVHGQCTLSPHVQQNAAPRINSSKKEMQFPRGDVVGCGKEVTKLVESANMGAGRVCCTTAAGHHLVVSKLVQLRIDSELQPYAWLLNPTRHDSKRFVTWDKTSQRARRFKNQSTCKTMWQVPRSERTICILFCTKET